jgi:tetratricopeptide (TPR) repeat protein
VAARFGADSIDPKKVGADVDVDMIVTGTLLRAGHEIRVSSQLTDAVSGSLLWSDQAQAPLGDLFRVQDELTHRIVASLSLPLTDTEQQQLRRDVPANAKAYEYFLRGNQLSCDSRQWPVARDLYLECVEEDPRFAPAWARLGHMHHVISKYMLAGAPEGLVQAEEALRRALQLNPELPVAHKLLAQLEVDLGRARDAMVRLVERSQSADPELFAGLVSVCRYCGLLDASVAAHARATALEPKIRTSVPHTWFLQADHDRVASTKIQEFPYIVALSLARLGRHDEALTALRGLEDTVPPRLRDFVVAARALVEGNAADSIAAITRIVSSNFRDPEGLFYLSRHLAHLDQAGPAIELLQRVVDGGYYCYPTMARDPWLDSLRPTAAFVKLLHQAESRHREALAVFGHVGGHKVLGLASA